MIHEQPNERLVTQDAILRQKCKKALANHRAAAKKDGVKLAYGAADLIRLAQSRQTCTYCNAPLGWNWQFDHRWPLARNAFGHCLDNLAVVCSDCNLLKGQLSDLEFGFLLDWLLGKVHFNGQTLDLRGAADVRRRLLSGGKVYARGRK